MYAYPKNQQTSDRQLKDAKLMLRIRQAKHRRRSSGFSTSKPTAAEQKAAQEQAAQQAENLPPRGAR